MIMIYPNLECADFCNWMLNISTKRLSGPQNTLVQLIQSAALAGTSVTLVQWNNFQNFTAWRFALYQVYLNNQLNLAPKNNNVFVQNWLDRLRTEGFQAPSYKTLARLNIAFNYAQQFNLVSEIDFLWLSVLDDVQHCTMPLLSTNTNLCTFVGSPAFTPNVGLSGSLGLYVKTGWTELTDSVNWQLNSATIAAITTRSGTADEFCCGVYDSSTSGETILAPCLNPLLTYAWINGTSSTNASCVSSNGLTFGQRSTANIISVGKGNNLLSKSVYAASSLSSIEDYIFAYNFNNAPAGNYTDNIQLVCRAGGTVNATIFATFLQMLVTPLN
jgi:hypothetical protein